MVYNCLTNKNKRMEENTLVFIVMLIIIVVVISIVQGLGQNQSTKDEHELFKKQFESEYGVTHGVQAPKTLYWFSLIRRR